MTQEAETFLADERKHLESEIESLRRTIHAVNKRKIIQPGLRGVG